MYDVINVSDFKVLSLLSLSCANKLWIQDNQGVKWLLKYPRKGFPSESVNEKICCEVAKLFDIPFQVVELCTDSTGHLGCMCKDFLHDGEVFIPGEQLLGKELIVNTNISTSELAVRKTYVLTSILEVLSEQKEAFIRTLLFDSLVGNIHRAWGLINGQRLSLCYNYQSAFNSLEDETEDTWFQNVGYRREGEEVSFNKLFQNLCKDYPEIVSMFMRALAKPQVITQFASIVGSMPQPFSNLTSYQFDFLVIRRDKMIRVWKCMR